MRLIVFIFLTVSSFTAAAQNKPALYAELTSYVIRDVSKDWKKDTIGKDGYRFQVFKRLRYAKVDSISKQTLFKYLGKPQDIVHFFSGITHKNYVGYRYYVLCTNDYPKEKYFMGSYIGFVFDETETEFIEIEDGEYCG